MVEVDSGESGADNNSHRSNPDQPGQSVSADSSILTGQPVMQEHPRLLILKELSVRLKGATACTHKHKAKSAAVITSSPYTQRLDVEASKNEKKTKADRQQVSKGKAKPTSHGHKQDSSTGHSSHMAPQSADD